MSIRMREIRISDGNIVEVAKREYPFFHMVSKIVLPKDMNEQSKIWLDIKTKLYKDGEFKPLIINFQ